MVIELSVLVLSSKYDFSCDYVISKLLKAQVQYLRLNSEDLPFYRFSLDPLQRKLSCNIAEHSYLITEESLHSVWFRRGIYLRDYGSTISATIDDQIARVQWAAFIRSLLVFRNAKWINHPGHTYAAEQKALQLAVAHDLGFAIPATRFTNDRDAVSDIAGAKVVLKVLIRF
ncbi:MAG TPA: hypothetical protein VN684_06300 [Terriglobales bacterium]|nr:hypothetical protein [Terriglobales bacterium]